MPPSTTTPIQTGPPNGHLQCDAGPLELRKQVETADQDHGSGRGRPAQRGRAQASLGEVGDGVGPEAAERRGHRGQQHQISRRVADGVPECAEALEHGQAGHPQEGTQPTGTPRRWPTHSASPAPGGRP